MFISILVLIISCSKEITIDIPEHESKPVLNCLFTPDSIFKMHLSKSTSIFDAPVALTEGENILLYGNNVLVDSLNWDGEFYISEVKAKSNINYQVVWQKDGNIISSSDYVPELIPIQSATFRDSALVNEDGHYVSQAKIVIKDFTIESNYFELELTALLLPSDEFEVETYRARILASSDPVIIAEGLTEYYPYVYVFSDNYFNNSTYTLTINYLSPIHVSEMYEGYEHDLIIKLRSISENYYKYKKTLIVHEYNQDSEIWDNAGDPIPMFTNIEGGYGIFAGYAVDIDTITKK